jgi:hypothetical protein
MTSSLKFCADCAVPGPLNPRVAERVAARCTSCSRRFYTRHPRSIFCDECGSGQSVCRICSRSLLFPAAVPASPQLPGQMQPSSLLVIRHGERADDVDPNWHKKQRSSIQARFDPPLTRAGHHQARATGRHLKGKVDVILTSPCIRTVVMFFFFFFFF